MVNFFLIFEAGGQYGQFLKKLFQTGVHYFEKICIFLMITFNSWAIKIVLK